MQLHTELRAIATAANQQYRSDSDEVWAPPRTKEEFLFNLHVLASTNFDLRIDAIAKVYAEESKFNVFRSLEK